MKPSITIVIPAFQRETIFRTLESLKHQTISSEDYEVNVVVDDLASELYRKLAALTVPFAMRIFQQSHSGAASARNLGAKNAHANLLLFLDDDISVDSNFLELHQNAHRATANSLVFGTITTDPASPVTFLRKWMDEWKETYFSRCERKENLEPYLFCSANFSISKESFFAVGGFDESFQGYGWEEADLGLRLQQNGIQFFYLREAAGCELYIKDPELASSQYAYEKGRNEIRFVRKYPALRKHSAIREAFTGKFHTKFVIHLAWRLPNLLKFAGGLLPVESKRFRFRYLAHFWQGVKASGIQWSDLERMILQDTELQMESDLNSDLSDQSRVSVIVTTYNYGSFLKQALQSIFQQQAYERIHEIIVIDDGSTDHTDTVVSEFLDRIRYVRQENLGQAAALNSAVEIASGEIIAFLDPDDEWYPRKLRRSLEEFRNPEVGMVQHQLDVEESGKKSRRKLQKHLSSGWVREEALSFRLRCMPTSALLFRKSVLKRALLAPVSLRTGGADYYFAAVAGLFSRIVTISEPLALYRIHGKNYFKDNLEIDSLQAQLAVADVIFDRLCEVASAAGLSAPKGLERFRYGEYQSTRRIELAKAEQRYANIPKIFFDYLRNYAFLEYGLSLGFIQHAVPLAIYAILPSGLYKRLRFAFTLRN